MTQEILSTIVQNGWNLTAMDSVANADVMKAGTTSQYDLNPTIAGSGEVPAGSTFVIGDTEFVAFGSDTTEYSLPGNGIIRIGGDNPDDWNIISYSSTKMIWVGQFEDNSSYHYMLTLEK